MYKFIFLIIPIFVYAEDLRTLIEFAKQNNNLIQSNKFLESSKSKQLDSRKSAYFPTVDVGGYYQSLNDKTPNMSGDIYSGYATVGFDIYDGGKKSALVDVAKNEYKASSFDTREMKKNISLQIVQDFFTIKSLEATLKAKQDSNELLKEQLSRVQKFYSARLATKDDVDRLQSAYDTNIYEIESLKFQSLSVKRSLELKVGKSIDTLDSSNFDEQIRDEFELGDSVKSLMANKEAVLNSAESVDSIYYPQLRIEDTYSVYDYKRYDASHPQGLDNQNKIMLSLNMRLFDYSSAKESKQVLSLSSKALEEQVKYKSKEQQVEYELAQSRIKTSKIKIKSSRSALISAESAFETINKKYKAGIVDYIVYLDALSTKTNSKALYESSLNDLEVAYAIYYYQAGKNLEEYIK